MDPGCATQPLAVELSRVRDHYERALTAARRAREKVSRRGQSIVDYWIGRLEFGIGYFDVVQTVRRAARAEAEGQPQEARRQAEVALKQACAALEAYARIAQDQSTMERSRSWPSRSIVRSKGSWRRQTNPSGKAVVDPLISLKGTFSVTVLPWKRV